MFNPRKKKLALLNRIQNLKAVLEAAKIWQAFGGDSNHEGNSLKNRILTPRMCSIFTTLRKGELKAHRIAPIPHSPEAGEVRTVS